MPAIQLFVSTWEKNYEHIYHSPPHVSVTTGNILITIIRFAPYHLLLSSNRTFMTDSQYLDTIQIWWNLNVHHFCILLSTKSMVCQIDSNCSIFQSLNMLPFHIRLELLQLIYYSLISIFSKYHFKTGTHFLFFLSSQVFIAIEFDSYYFCILLWKIVKPRDHNEFKSPIGKIFRKCNQSDIIL